MFIFIQDFVNSAQGIRVILSPSARSRSATMQASSPFPAIQAPSDSRCFPPEFPREAAKARSPSQKSRTGAANPASDPHIGCADLTLDSLLPYEIFVMGSELLPLLAEIPEGSIYYPKALELQEKVKTLASWPTAIVPKDSILREFLGQN